MTQKLESQTGFTIIKLGVTEVVESTQTIVHLIRRNSIRDIISNIEVEIGNEDVSPWIRNKVTNIKDKAEIIVAHRQKRGLINIVGRTSKWLFGTMDDVDKKEISENIQQLEINNQKIMKGVNQQIKINDYFNETLKLFLQTNSKNQNEILRNFKNLSEEIKELVKSQRILDLSLKLQILDDKINQILDSIASIKAGILHPGILTSEEIRDLNITLDKLQNARTGILEMDGDKLLISIKLPSSYKQIPYKLLTPLPDKDNREIAEEPQTFIEIDDTKYELERKILYKNELKLLKTCLNTGCTKRTNKKENIVKVNHNVILGINLRYPKINNYCDERKINISGNYIFNIKNCTIEINNKNYSNMYKEEENDIFEMFNPQWKDINVTFEDVTIKSVNNLEKIQEFQLHKKLTFSLQGLMFAIIIVIIVVLILRTQRKKTHNVKLPPNKASETLHQESKDNLNGGRVTLCNSVPNFSC